MSDEKKKEEKEVSQEEQQQQVVTGALFKHPDSPSQEMIDQWKATHGEVFATGFSDDELFVFRPVFRQEWLALQENSQQQEGMTQALFEEAVCGLCVLWRSNKAEWAQTKGGTVSSLYEMILQHSNFVSPQAAAMLVVRL